MKWKIVSVVQRWPPAGVNFDLHLCADIFHSFLHLQFFWSYLETQSQEIKSQSTHTVAMNPYCNRKSLLCTSSWKATVLTEPSCLMRLATTSSGLPRLTIRLLSRRCENRHTGKSHTMPGNLHPGYWTTREKNHQNTVCSTLSYENRTPYRLRCVRILLHLHRLNP